MAQYPLDMGRRSSSSSNALAVQVDAQGKVKYDTVARQGHNDKRIVHTSFQDLIPLRQRADVGEISLDRPSEEQVAAQTEKTKDALAKLVSGAVAAQKPKNVKGISRNDPTYVRYTPANQMGDITRKNDRIMKIVERQQDPMEPPKFKSVLHFGVLRSSEERMLTLHLSDTRKYPEDPRHRRHQSCTRHRANSPRKIRKLGRSLPLFQIGRILRDTLCR